MGIMPNNHSKAGFMRKVLLALVLLGTAPALPVHAAPTVLPALAAVATPGEATVQTVQYRYDRREALRRQEFRRRQEIRREQLRRRQAVRRGYVRPY